jgi:hypothetical protein
MAHVVIRTIPFAARLRAAAGARELLQRDRARATKFLMGVSPHGPRPHLLVEERQHKGGAVSDPFTPTTPFAPTTTVPPGTGGSTAGGTDDSIDVTDTG